MGTDSKSRRGARVGGRGRAHPRAEQPTAGRPRCYLHMIDLTVTGLNGVQVPESKQGFECEQSTFTGKPVLNLEHVTRKGATRPARRPGAVLLSRLRARRRAGASRSAGSPQVPADTQSCLPGLCFTVEPRNGFLLFRCTLPFPDSATRELRGQNLVLPGMSPATLLPPVLEAPRPAERTSVAAALGAAAHGQRDLLRPLVPHRGHATKRLPN